MKIKLIAILCCLTATVAQAQKVNWAVLGGANYSQTPSGDPTLSNNGGIAGFQIEGRVYYTTKSPWTFISGLSFIQKGGNQEKTNYYYTPPGQYNGKSNHVGVKYGSIRYRLNYLSIPMKAGYKFTLTENFTLLPHIGMGIAYGFNAGNAEMDVIGQRIYKWKPFDGYTNKIEIDKFDRLDVCASVGIEAHIKKHYVLSATYDYGLKKIQEDLSIRNSTLQLSVGYLF